MTVVVPINHDNSQVETLVARKLSRNCVHRTPDHRYVIGIATEKCRTHKFREEEQQHYIVGRTHRMSCLCYVTWYERNYFTGERPTEPFLVFYIWGCDLMIGVLHTPSNSSRSTSQRGPRIRCRVTDITNCLINNK